MKLKYKKLNENALEPTYGTELSAGADLYSVATGAINIKPGESTMVHTGIAVAIPDGHVGLVFARSGLACKRGLAPANKVGVIDADYRGEILVCLRNESNQSQIIGSGERIAQLVVIKYDNCKFEEVEDLEDTDRGSGGFGSTGIK